jgi:uncharacterized protein YodC (DUF2158 family)
MFDTRGKPGFHKFPLRIGDDVTLHGGGQVMTVVDFDETGEVTVAWRCGKGKDCSDDLPSHLVRPDGRRCVRGARLETGFVR